jgi:hypothetical protein
MLDSQNYTEGRTNQLYVPTNLIFNELMGVTELYDFNLWFSIHYKNGKDYPSVSTPTSTCRLRLLSTKFSLYVFERKK